MVNNVTNNSTAATAAPAESGLKAFFDNEMFKALRKAHEEWNNLPEVNQLAWRVVSLQRYHEALPHLTDMTRAAKAFAKNPNAKGIYIFQKLSDASVPTILKWCDLSDNEQKHWAEEQAKPNHVEFEFNKNDLGFDSESQYEVFMHVERCYMRFEDMLQRGEIQV